MEEHHKTAQTQPVHTQPAHNAAVEQKAPSSDRFWKVTTVVLIVLLAVFMWKGNGGSAPAGGAVVADVPGAPAPSAAPVDMDALVDDDTVLGKKDAPVTIVEFSDYECPFCARFHEQTFRELKKLYIDTGKVKFVYRDFPLSFHPNAQKAAEAAECAGEQGKYWEMHEKLFTEGVSGGVAGFKQYAKSIKVKDQKAFDSCLDGGETAAEIRKDFSDGQRVGVQGTPAFFVNGQIISGAQPLSVFQQVIDAELAK
ncbi:DsbA family protein [Candidatus Woesearchaeota archaeon]|nr:DsbA family protein [Candidatus Woesearchaeota archaeon]